MNKELVEQITRLVLERISEHQSLNQIPLGEGELLDWNQIHQKHEVEKSSPYLIPLSDEELKDWNLIGRANDLTNNALDSQVSNMVRFSKFIS